MKQIWKTRNNKRNDFIKGNGGGKEKEYAGQFLLPAAAIFIGAVFLYLGVSRGEAAVVLRKAVTICLECIGIG